MQYRIVIQLGLEVVLVSRASYPDEDTALAAIQEQYQGMSPMQVMSEDELSKLTARQVFFPEGAP